MNSPSSILDVLIADGPDETQLPVIQPLLDAVQRTHKVEGHDLSGRLFHTLLTDAKFTGAYYTSVPAATLLSPPGLSRLAGGRGLARPRVPRVVERG